MTSLREKLVEEGERAHRVLAPFIRRTPLLHAPGISRLLGLNIHLKLENLQISSSFKYRPALYNILRFRELSTACGVVTASSGNFAAALAYAARDHGVPVTIVFRPSASPFKMEKARRLGARIVHCDDDYRAREHQVERLAGEEGLWRAHPHGSFLTLAGNSTLARELMLENCQARTVLVPASGAGLVGALAAFLGPGGWSVWGVQPAANGSLAASLEEGKPVHHGNIKTCADGLTAACPGELGFSLFREFGSGAIQVSEESLLEATRLLFEEEGLMVEPAGAAGLAALLDSTESLESRDVLLIVTGGNVDPRSWSRRVSGQL